MFFLSLFFSLLFASFFLSSHSSLICLLFLLSLNAIFLSSHIFSSFFHLSPPLFSHLNFFPRLSSYPPPPSCFLFSLLTSLLYSPLSSSSVLLFPIHLCFSLTFSLVLYSFLFLSSHFLPFLPSNLSLFSLITSHVLPLFLLSSLLVYSLLFLAQWASIRWSICLVMRPVHPYQPTLEQGLKKNPFTLLISSLISSLYLRTFYLPTVYLLFSHFFSLRLSFSFFPPRSYLASHLHSQPLSSLLMFLISLFLSSLYYLSPILSPFGTASEKSPPPHSFYFLNCLFSLCLSYLDTDQDKRWSVR